MTCEAGRYSLAGGLRIIGYRDLHERPDDAEDAAPALTQSMIAAGSA